jgi:UDP-N-acetylglucosamine 2-epimerase (non-hydrolysing)
MKQIKVMSIFGTRPEAIKMCPLVKELERRSQFESMVCVTAQHRQMLDQVLKVFDIQPDYDMNIMSSGQTLYDITSRVLSGLGDLFQKVRPDLVLVHGDTTTTFTAALAAFYAKIPVGHVEAGLRTFDKYSPFPEEMNRCLTGRIAELHFAPTENNKKNLIHENITQNIYVTGNTVIDSFAYTIQKDYVFHDELLNHINFSDGRYILLTAHRRENLGQPLENICNAVKDIVEEFPDIHVIYPVHLNPAVRNTVFPSLGGHERIHLIDPVDVTDMHNLMAKCFLVMTDSGGLQEEAPSLGSPVLVLRTETERPEAVAAGTAKLAGIERETIFHMAKELITDEQKYREMAKAVNPYGDGHASERIADAVIAKFMYSIGRNS